MKPACETCKFYQPPSQVQQLDATCRKDPPRAIPVPVNTPAGSTVITMGIWPPVQPQDWCGSYSQAAIRWSTVQDKFTCEPCMNLDGEIVEGDLPPFKGCRAERCRCTVEAVTRD